MNIPKSEVCMDYYVAISESETEDPIEVPVETDGGVLLTSVQSQFPSAVGLKFRNPNNRAFRGVRLADGVLYPPEGGWGDGVYLVNTAKTQTDNKRKMESLCSDNKRKMEDSAQAEVSKTKRPTPQASDLVVLNLPYHYTKENLAEFFSKYGELSFTQIMKNTEGMSRGFGFIRFVDYDDQKRVNGASFVIDGRKVQVKKPNSQSPELCRVFVGRLTEKISKDDLMEHFEQFGPISEIYYDQGRKQFAFVTFEESCMADRAIADKSHYIRDMHVVVRPADPMDKNKQNPSSSSAHPQQSKLASFYNPTIPPNQMLMYSPENKYSPGSPSYDGYSQIASTSNPNVGPSSWGYSNGGAMNQMMNKSPHYNNQAPHYLNQAPMSPPGQTIDPGTFGQEMLNAMAKMMATAMTGSLNAQNNSGPSSQNGHLNSQHMNGGGSNGNRMNHSYDHHRIPSAASTSSMQPASQANLPPRYNNNIPNPYKSPPHDPYSNMY